MQNPDFAARELEPGDVADDDHSVVLALVRVVDELQHLSEELSLGYDNGRWMFLKNRAKQ